MKTCKREDTNREREGKREMHTYIKHTGIETKTYKRVDTKRERERGGDMIICQKEQQRDTGMERERERRGGWGWGEEIGIVVRIFTI